MRYDGGIQVLASFVPDQYVPSIYKINLEALKAKGMKTLIVDLDNTLVESDCRDATPVLLEWLQRTKELGFQVMIVSNNNKNRVSRFAAPLGIPFIHRARKPLSAAFRKAIKELGAEVDSTVMIGDQLLTDVLGGNRMGLYTILVVPISKIEGFGTKINRRLERIVLSRLEKRGLFVRKGDQYS
jgi:HAD superfamily phosphatase (TIGR01668 family)